MRHLPTTTHPAPMARSGPWRWLGLGCGGMLAVLLCSCLVLGLGAGARANATKHWQIAVTSVGRRSALAWNSCGGQQAAVGEWLFVGVTLTNVGGENYGVNTWDFAVRDGAGKLYKHSNEWIALTHPERQGYQSANNHPVPPGLAVPILLIFDMNPAATGLELVFNQQRNLRIALPTR